MKQSITPWANPWFSNNQWPNPWLINNPWQGFLTAGNSASAENINPITTFFSPSLEFNYSGNREIETAVISDVASYGKQLGKLSEAVLELANGKKGKAVAALEKLVEDIDEVKQKVKEKSLEEQLDALKANHPKAFETLLEKYN